MNVLGKLIVVLFLLLQTARAEMSDTDLKKLAKELFEMERSGFRFDPPQTNLVKPQLTMVKMQKQAQEEENHFEKVFVSGNMKVRKLIKLRKNVYRVLFKVDQHQDDFIMVVYNSPKKIQKYGRGEFLSPPNKIYMNQLFK